MRANGIVLAGGTVEGELKNRLNIENEALIPIGRRFMVEYVVGAIEESGAVDRIALVGPKELSWKYAGSGTVTVVSPGRTVTGSVLNGLSALPESEYVLIATSDIPLVTPAAVRGFLKACEEAGPADIYYPIVERSLSESRFPGAVRTYVDFVEGSFTGGNVFLIRPEIVKPRVEIAEKLVSLRKDPLGLCMTIGPLFIAKFLMKRLSIREAEEKFSKLLGVKGVAVRCDYPEIGMDVDKPSDLDLVEQVLGAG